MAGVGATNDQAVIYALKKFNEWLKKYAPPEAKHMNFSQVGSWTMLKSAPLKKRI